MKYSTIPWKGPCNTAFEIVCSRLKCYQYQRPNLQPHDDLRRRTDTRDYRGLISSDDVQAKTELDADKIDLESGSYDSAFYWDEEATLLSDLITGPEQGGVEYLEALAETLHVPFSEQGKLLKQDIAQTLVSTNNRVKAVIRVLDQNIDVTYGQGLSIFNAACKDIERSMHAQHMDFKDVYDSVTCRIEEAYKELEELYLARDALWLAFHEAIERIVNPTLKQLKETPARIESTINKLERPGRFAKDDF